MVNQEIVSSYVKSLERALGHNEDFMAVFKKLQKDCHDLQGEAVAIGSELVAPMGSSTARGKALERILKRHKSLVSFKLKQKAVGGRSAA